MHGSVRLLVLMVALVALTATTAGARIMAPEVFNGQRGSTLVFVDEDALSRIDFSICREGTITMVVFDTDLRYQPERIVWRGRLSTYEASRSFESYYHDGETRDDRTIEVTTWRGKGGGMSGLAIEYVVETDEFRAGHVSDGYVHMGTLSLR